jgi:hypothetical protein
VRNPPRRLPGGSTLLDESGLSPICQGNDPKASAFLVTHISQQTANCRGPRSYFGYLNSGAAFSASFVVFIFATHLSFFTSWVIATDAGETAT